MKTKAALIFLVAFAAILFVQNNKAFATAADTIQYTWYITSRPADRLLCTLWIGKQPVDADLVAACGTSDVDDYRLDVLDIATGTTACQVPASGIRNLNASCHLFQPLDHYRLLIIQPEFTRLLCSVTTLDPTGPSDEEIMRACGQDVWYMLNNGQADRALVNAGPTPQPDPICNMPGVPDGDGLFEQPSSADQLATHNDYTLLAGRIIFYGGAPAAEACPGWGLLSNGAADACGLDAAREPMTALQNIYDQHILDAASANQVPARLLKALIAKESQFWPLWVRDDEITLMQLTNNGLDVLLQYDPYIYHDLCPDCETGYGMQSEWTKQIIRQTLRARLTCETCNVNQAIRAAQAHIPILARGLRAYRCLSAELVRRQTGQPPATVIDNTTMWRLTVAAYHGGYACAERAIAAAAPSFDWGTISSALCSDAREYTDQVSR